MSLNILTTDWSIKPINISSLGNNLVIDNLSGHRIEIGYLLIQNLGTVSVNVKFVETDEGGANPVDLSGVIKLSGDGGYEFNATLCPIPVGLNKEFHINLSTANNIQGFVLYRRIKKAND